MLQKLLKFHRGPVHLGQAMKESLQSEPISPVLIDEHYIAMDRRVNITLRTVADCIKKYGADKVIHDDGL